MKPLVGIRVLDLTHVLAGPFCTHQLAMLGADVIKIEPPSKPDMTREEGVIPELNDKQYGTYFQAQNAGKRAITLDLKSAEGAAAMRKLAAGADVLVQNFAGHAMKRLGFGYDEVARVNPQLVYCSISAFGSTGPKAGHPAYDVVIQAYSGLMASNGTPDTRPVRVGPPMVDYGTGAQAALAISAALLQRERTGKGQFIDVAMLDAALMLMSASVTDTIATGTPPEPHGNVHPKYAGYATFETADGLLMIGAWTNKQLASLLRTLGEAKRATAVENTSRADIARGQCKDRQLIAKHLTAKSAFEWEQLLNEAHVPAARIRTIDEAISEDQVKSRAVLQPSGNAAADGPVSLPTAAFTYVHGSPSIDRPPPRHGEHTNDVLEEFGFSAEEIRSLRATGAV